MVTKNQVTSSREEMICALLDDKFAPFFELEERERRYPDIVRGRSRRATAMHFGYRQEKITAVERERLYLETLNSADLEALVRKMGSDKKRRPPQEERLFFNEPFADTHYYHWASKTHWSLEQVAALLLGKDPDIVNLLSLKHLHVESPFAANFVRLLHLVHEMKERGEWTEYATPEEVLAWADAHQVEVPPKLSESIEAHTATRDAEWATWWEKLDKASTRSETLPTPHEKTALARKLETMEKIAIAMAIDWHGYDPWAAKSDVPKMIEDASQRVGCPVSNDTIRTRLQSSARHVDRERVFKSESGLPAKR